MKLLKKISEWTQDIILFPYGICWVIYMFFTDPWGSQADKEYMKEVADEIVQERLIEAKYKDRKGTWMKTYTGKRFYPLDPRPEDFDIKDIAHALSNICRYGGHSIKHYSVAEHCCMCANAILLTFPNARLAALSCLLHDAAEAYLGDIPTPLKQQIPAYEPLENNVMQQLLIGLGLDDKDWSTDLVKRIDRRALATEVMYVFDKYPHDWDCIKGVPTIPIPVKFLTPQKAERKFLELYNQLTYALPFTLHSGEPK